MIVYCTTDLIFATKIRSTAEALHLPTRPARDAGMLANRLNQIDDGKLNAPVTGVIIDLEMGDAGIAMLEQTKQHDAGIPVVAFGSHVATQVLRAASERGADHVMPRSQFSSQLPEVLRMLCPSEK